MHPQPRPFFPLGRRELVERAADGQAAAIEDVRADHGALLFLTDSGFSSILVTSVHFSGLCLAMRRMTKEKRHDLSHEVFYRKNNYSLFCPIGGMDCKGAVYNPLHREKAANSAGGNTP